MAKLNVGDMVKVVADKSQLDWISVNLSLIQPNGIYKIVGVHDSGYELHQRHSSTWVNLDYVELYNPVHVPPSKPKPRTRTLSSGKRQFDVTYKLSVIRKVREARRNGKRGDIKVILEAYQVDNNRLAYWEKQHDQGHFDQGRAVAFSRKTTMIKG